VSWPAPYRGEQRQTVKAGDHAGRAVKQECVKRLAVDPVERGLCKVGGNRELRVQRPHRAHAANRANLWQLGHMTGIAATLAGDLEVVSCFLQTTRRSRAGRSYENGGSADVGVDAGAFGVVFGAAAVAMVGGAVRGAGSETPTTGGSVRARLAGDAILPRWPIRDRPLFQAVQELDLERGRPTGNTVIDFYNPTAFTFNITSSQPSPLRPLRPTSQSPAWLTGPSTR